MIAIFNTFLRNYYRAFYYFSYPVRYLILLLNFIRLNNFNYDKLIIRNDRIGDNIILLPFILGSDTKENIYYISDYLNNIINDLKINTHWQALDKKNNKKDLLVLNLAGEKSKNINYNFKNNILTISQLKITLNFDYGLPILFTPNYASNLSQSEFTNNGLKFLKIDSNPIKGIERLNKIIPNSNLLKKNQKVILILGLGLDDGRKINENQLKRISFLLKENELETYILSEPDFKIKIHNISKKYNIKIIDSRKLTDLFYIFKNSKLVIGYDCGPMHIASLLTQTITLNSHTSLNQWCKHIWHKKIKKHTFNSFDKKIYLEEMLNLGSNKKNWILYENTNRCPIHSDKRFLKLTPRDKCCDINLLYLEKIILKVLDSENSK